MHRIRHNGRTTVLLAEAQFNVDNTKWLAGTGTDESWRHLEHRRHRRSHHDAARADRNHSGDPTVRCSASRFWSGQRCRRASRPRGQRLAILGDWSGFTIVDRLGAQIELITHLFGATNRFPTEAARDLVNLAIFVGCHQAERAALDLLRIAS